MSDYMIQKADDQIQGAIEEQKTLIELWDEEINRLKQELQKTRYRLAKAEKVIEFYADGDNYGHISPEIATYSVIDDIDLGVGDFMLNDSVDDERVGGKRARLYFKDKQGE